MVNLPAFPVRTGREPGGARATLSDLPYVAVPMERVRPEDPWTPTFLFFMGVLLLAMAAAILLLALANPIQAKSKIAILSTWPMAMGLWMLRAYRRAKVGQAEEPDAFVVPARATAIPANPLNLVMVPMQVRVYGREKEARIAIPRRLLADITLDAPLYLMAVPRGVLVTCYYDPVLAGEALSAALADMENGQLPSAQRACDQADAREEEPFRIRWTPTTLDVNEAHFACGSALPVGAVKPQSTMSGTLMAVLGGFALTVLGFMTLHLDLSRLTGAKWIGTSSLLMCCAIFSGGIVRLRRRIPLKAAGEGVCELTPTRITWSDGRIEASHELGAIERFIETPRLFVLQRDRQYWAIPKRMLAGRDEVQRLRQLLERRIPRQGGLQ